MKRFVIAWMAACLFPLAVTAYNPYAPNVFAEAEKNTPGYRAAAALIVAGYATGYDEGLLARAHLTRYELAQALAAVLENPATPQNDADVITACREYKRELDALGVRGPKGAARDHWRIGGDVRVRRQDDATEHKTDARARVNLTYAIK